VPLPTEADSRKPWPPTTWQPVARDIDEAAAWYSGDQRKLIDFYGGGNTAVRPSERGSIRSAVSRFFWGRRSNDQASGRQRIHVPAAADVAAVSADLLFGDEIVLTIPVAHDATPTKTENDQAAEGEGEQREAAQPTPEQTEALETEARLNELAESDGWASTLLEAAEVCAGLGDVYLRALWDPVIADHPMLTIVHPDHAVPEFRWGRLIAVTFWRQVEVDSTGNVWRHLELYEPGRITHGLYEGNQRALGVQRPLDAHPETARLDVDDDGVITLPESMRDVLLVRHVKNVGPNRKHRGMPIGRSDCAGTEDLMDALDETYTAWMREIRLVKPRIIVPNEFLERRGRGAGAIFDADTEVFSPLEMDPQSQDKAGITITEFDLHTEQYEQTCRALFTQIVQTAGYSPQSFGLPAEGMAQTATEVDAREDRSTRTTGRKQRYWRRALEDMFEIVLMLDLEFFGSQVTPMRPRVSWPEAAEADMRETASTLNLLNLAKAISTEGKVRMLRPEWDDTEVTAEVDRIVAENTTQVADPTGGFV
jgi:hypothetical protein